MVETTSSARALLRRHMPSLFKVAFLAGGSREAALHQLRFLVNEVAAAGGIADSEDPGIVLTGLLVRGLEHRLGGTTPWTFDGLDALLRSDITRPIDLSSPPLDDDPKRLHAMLWSLKRTCLLATLGALPISLRMATILVDLLALSPETAAEIAGTGLRAFRVRLTRARKRLEDYLAPRCQHIAPDNPCTCVGRLSIAVEAGFVTYPEDADRLPPVPHDAAAPMRTAGRLLQSLPLPEIAPEEVRALLAAV